MKVNVYFELDLDKGDTLQKAVDALMAKEANKAQPETAPDRKPCGFAVQEAPADPSEPEIVEEEKPAPKKRSRKTAPKKAEPEEALEGEVVEEEVPTTPKAPSTVSQADVRAAAIVAMNANKRAEVEAIFQKYGADKLANLDPSTFPAVLEDLKALA